MNQPVLVPLDVEHTELFAEKLVNMTPWLELGYQRQTLRDYLLGQGNGFRAMCMRTDGVSAGIIATRSPWLRGTLIELLAILPEYQHQGLGKWLIHKLTEETRSRKGKNLWTLVSAFNKPAMCFYQSCGFNVIGELEDFIVKGKDEILMRLVIDSE